MAGDVHGNNPSVRGVIVRFRVNEPLLHTKPGVASECATRDTKTHQATPRHFSPLLGGSQLQCSANSIDLTVANCAGCVGGNRRLSFRILPPRVYSFFLLSGSGWGDAVREVRAEEREQMSVGKETDASRQPLLDVGNRLVSHASRSEWR